MSAPRKRPFVEKGKGYVRVGPTKVIYWTKGLEINVPHILVTTITTSILVGAIIGLYSKWQLDKQVEAIENTIRKEAGWGGL